MSRDPRVDAYIAARAEFARPILEHIRARVHATCPDAVETIKWGMPFFTLGGRPFANMAAFKAHASFGFWRSEAAARGREGEAMGQYGRLTKLSDLPAADVLDAQISRAAELLSTAPAKSPRPTPRAEAEVPPALAAALADDPVAHATFYDRFSPSHRREYCEWVAEAKRAETRDRRVATAIEWLREGRQRNWKYQAG